MNNVAGARPWQQFYTVTRRCVLKPTASLHNRHHSRLLACLMASAASEPMQSGTGGGLASSLWNKHRLQAMLALYHPFVVSLAAGVLDIRAFRHYIAQDAFFLRAFATSYGIAQGNVDDDPSILSIKQLRQAVLDELRMHSSYAEAWGVDLSIESIPNKATLKYTELLLETAAGKGRIGGNVLEKKKQAALTIGAMTPCMRLYAFLGEELMKSLDSNLADTPYHDWIDTYASNAFQSSTLQIEQLLESLAACLGEEDMAQLESLYSQALNLELWFFSAQPNCQCTLVPFIKRQDDDGSHVRYLLVTDFDLTCSVTDSCSALAKVSLAAVSEESFSELKEKWDLLNNTYSEQYGKISALPENQENRHYDVAGLRSFLEQLSEFEIQSNAEVAKQGVFKGLDLEDIRRAGGEMVLQNGCSAFFHEVSLHYSHVDAHVVSVCWSKSFIEGALSKEGMHSVKVHSNELRVSGSCTTGDLVRAVETPLDKERIFEELMRNTMDHATASTRNIYIGDTATDLLCLLKADLGIVIGSNPTLRHVAKAFGVSLEPLYKGILKKVKSHGGTESERQHPRVLYTVSGWHEIHALLIGSPDSQSCPCPYK